MKQTPSKKCTLINTIRDFMLLIITIVLIYWLLAPDKERHFNPVSIADLHGVWTTTHPNYLDRFLQFSNRTITFGWGEGGAGAYTIDKLDSAPAKNGTSVHIRYVDMDGTAYRLSFHYVDQGGGTIWMQNLKAVYYRTSAEPTYDYPLQ
ncbi:hypothetical protein DSCA_44670 [Desulfosarcina alkanivorans]|uniref:DUF2850 domain-containing protein n=1 Tax=Desulfosarcina alkanivorans TaxID=571177 RepID=A0A5K7Z160_9BACT|nr:hypothetical protein [Desulfosarcina alkanivorans]BBO70537.1 hypothetical protein DSCA_44670 [Desulfosarcina alkanivorans]